MSVEEVVERKKSCELCLRPWRQLQRRFSDDPESSLVAHEQVFEVEARRRLSDLLPTAVADADDLPCRKHDLEGHDQVARMSEARPQQREPATRNPTADKRARVRRGRIREEHAVLLELLIELQHADARADG